jgi:serine/threonine protein phosphatase PrpC
MYVFESIFRFISNIGRTAASPIRNVGFRLRMIRTQNPLSRAVFAGRRSFRQIGSSIRMPFRYFGSVISRITGRVGIKIPGLGGGKGKDLPDARGRTRKWGPKRKQFRAYQEAQYSQIHLVDLQSGERTILHIGNTVGQSSTDVTLGAGKHKPVHFQFSQVNPEQFKAHIMLTHLAGHVPVHIDGERIAQHGPIHHGSRITVGSYQYGVELYAWDKSPATTQVEAGWATTVGPVRAINEDAIGIYQHPEAYLFVVADGVGGGEAGDRISEFAVQYMLAVFHKNIRYSHFRWHDIYEKAFRNINTEVRQFADRYAFIAGTTLTAVVIKDWEAHIAHVGDSRLYHRHLNTMRQVTEDHSKESSDEDNGYTDTKGEPLRQKRNVLTKAIGKNDTIRPDLFTIRLQPGDQLLLCTDGVTDLVDTAELTRLMATSRAEELPNHLIDLVNEREGRDNGTAIAVDVLSHAYSQDTWLAEPDERVYVGYNSMWSLRLRPPRELHTEPLGVVRVARWVLLLGIAVILAVVLGAVLMHERDEVIPPPVEILSPTPTDTPMDQPTARSQPTATATNTPTPVPTSSPVPSPLPPTSTLRPSVSRMREPVPVVGNDTGAYQGDLDPVITNGGL